MRRVTLLSLPLTLLLLAGVVTGEDTKPRAAEDAKPRTAPAPAALYDVAEFIKEYDRDGDGSLSKEELPARFRHNFAKLDANKDGKVSREELEKGLAHLHSKRRPSDFIHILVEMSDCDECCAEELATVYTFLRKMDRDGDGKISAEELKASREALVNARAKELMEELDTDKDGKISMKEARGSLRHHFKVLDLDGDGFISREELMKAVNHPVGGAKEGSPKEGSKPAGLRDSK